MDQNHVSVLRCIRISDTSRCLPQIRPRYGKATTPADDHMAEREQRPARSEYSGKYPSFRAATDENVEMRTAVCIQDGPMRHQVRLTVDRKRQSCPGRAP